MVELLFEGLVTSGVDSVDRRVHAKRTARFAEKHGLRYEAVAEAPRIAQAFGEIGTGALRNLVSGQFDGGHVLAWERTVAVPLGEDHVEHQNLHPGGAFIAVPLARARPGVVVRKWVPVFTKDECGWLPGGTRVHLQDATAERLMRVSAVEHAFARALIDERALLAKPRRSWAVLGGWVVAWGEERLRRRGKRGLHAEVAFLRELAARCDRL
ncbi:hypothetical protein AB0B28_02205 [Glycomyces sp. NPDC046736]|uniref:hypothetical protein n=1 Tax=Glycomyces sp. NPDC046736 TaxID=3155615 RepID=UPI0033E3330D